MVKTIINHPPVITVFLRGMVTIPNWVIYGIVLPTLYDSMVILVMDNDDSLAKISPDGTRSRGSPGKSKKNRPGTVKHPQVCDGFKVNLG